VAERAAELQGLRVLVVEDEFLVSIDIEAMLKELGCEVVGPIGDLDAALEAARRQAMDVAALDMNIGGRPIAPVADALRARGIPVVFITGYGPDAGDAFARTGDAPVLAKPFTTRDLRRALRAVAGGAGGGA
jgi:CheY-like chemotaxis protein